MNKSKFSFYIVLLGVFALTAEIANGQTQVESDTALRMLNAQGQQFEQKIVKVTDNVITAVEFHGANTSMIVGTDGVIIFDTLMGPTSAANALEALRGLEAREYNAPNRNYYLSYANELDSGRLSEIWF